MRWLMAIIGSGEVEVWARKKERRRRRRGRGEVPMVKGGGLRWVVGVFGEEKGQAKRSTPWCRWVRLGASLTVYEIFQENFMSKH